MNIFIILKKSTMLVLNYKLMWEDAYEIKNRGMYQYLYY